MSDEAPWLKDPVVDDAEPWKKDPVVKNEAAPWESDPIVQAKPQIAPEELAQKSHGEIIASVHPEQKGTPEYDAAFKADQLRQQRGIGAKALEFAGAAAENLATPTGWFRNAKGVFNFLTGFPQIAANTAMEAKGLYPKTTNVLTAGMGALIPGAGDKGINPTNLVIPGLDGILPQPVLDAAGKLTQAPDPLTLQAEATLTGQHGEQSLSHLADATVGKLASTAAKMDDPDPDRTAYRQRFVRRNPLKLDAKQMAARQAQWKAEDAAERKIRDEDVDRKVFDQRVLASHSARQLAEGRPITTGPIAELYKLAGQDVTEEVSPEALKAAGVSPVRQAAIERMAAAEDPNNVLLSLAPGVPGAATVGGAATSAAGHIASGLGSLANVTERVTNPLSWIHKINPTAAAVDAGVRKVTQAGGRGLKWLGDSMIQQGKELRTGTPSALTTEAATAAVKGESAIGTNIARKVGDTIAHGAQTAVGMAPLNLALAQGDPEELANLEAGAAAFGGTLSAFRRNRPMLVEGARPHLRSEGARALAEAGEGNDPLAKKSAAYVMSLPEEARDRTLEAIGALQGLPIATGKGTGRAKLYVLSEPDYLQAQQEQFGTEKGAMGGGRGYFHTNSGASYINGDYHTGEPVELSHTIGHEFGGHAAMNVMLAAGDRGGALFDGLVGHAREALLPGGKVTPAFQRFVNEYNRRFDPTGKTKAIDVNNQNSIDEFISETAGQILASKGVGEIAVPKNIQDRISDGIGRFMGQMLGMDSRTIGTKTNFDREQIGSLNDLVQETLAQVAGMKLREGAATPEPGKTDTTRIAELNEILANPRPPAGSQLADVTAWRQEQRAARSELSDLTGEPAATARSGSAPTIVSPPEVVADAAKALAALGIRGVRARALIRMANEQHGQPITDTQRLVQGAMRIHGGKAVTPGEFVAKPEVAKEPVSAPTGDKATFRNERGDERMVIGLSPDAPQVGDIVVTREGEIRRVTRAVGGTVDTARPIDPLNARGTKTHKVEDVAKLDHLYAPTPEGAAPAPAAKPEMRVEPRGDRFIVVDAAGNPVGKNTFSTEAAAQQSISRTGQKSTFGLPPSIDGNDIIDAVLTETRGDGIHIPGGKLPEDVSSLFPRQGIWKNTLLNGKNTNVTLNEVARLVHDLGFGDGTIDTLLSEMHKAATARGNLRDQQAAEEKRLKDAEKTAKKGAENEPQPPEPTEPPPEGEGVPPVATEVAESPVETHGAPQPAPLQADELSRIAASAQASAVAAEKNPNSDAAQKRIRKATVMAVIKAHSGRLPLNHQGMRLRVDQFGRETVSGTLDTGGDFENWLVAQSSLGPVGTMNLVRLQDLLGRTVQIDYRHASTGEGEAHADTRRSAQAQETAQQRAEDAGKGETRRKTVVPLQIEYNPGTNSFTVLGASPEKLLSNFNHLTTAMQANGEESPYRDIHDRQFAADMAGYVRNHENGWQGDGSAPMVDAQGVRQKAEGEPYRIDEARFEFLNAVLGDEGAKSNTAQGKEKSALAQFNARMVDPETGETNALRDRLNKKLGPMPETDKDGQPTGRTKPWSQATLENPISEKIRPDLVEAIHPEVTSDDQSIREHGFRGDIGKFFAKGIPDRASTAAGFMPSTGEGPKTPQERARERLAAGGKFMPFDNIRPAALEAWKNENGDEPITEARAWWVDRHGNLIPIRWEHNEINQYVPASEQSKDPVEDAIRHGWVRATTDLGLGGNSPDVHYEGTINPAQRRSLRELTEDRGGKLVNPGGRDSLYFMPTSGTPKPEGEEPPGTPARQESPSDRPAIEGAASAKNPVSEAQRNENLMTEAEQAGLSPSLETIKGVLRNDPAALDKLRRMIADKTGSPAKWMPSTKTVPSWFEDKHMEDMAEPAMEEMLREYPDIHPDRDEYAEKMGGIMVRMLQEKWQREGRPQEGGQGEPKLGQWAAILLEAAGGSIARARAGASTAAEGDVPQMLQGHMRSIAPSMRSEFREAAEQLRQLGRHRAGDERPEMSTATPHQEGPYSTRHVGNYFFVVVDAGGNPVTGEHLSESEARTEASERNAGSPATRDAGRQSAATPRYDVRRGTGTSWNVVDASTGQVEWSHSDEQAARRAAVQMNQEPARQPMERQQRREPARITDTERERQRNEIMTRARRELTNTGGITDAVSRAWGGVNNEVVPDYDSRGKLGQIVREVRDSSLESVNHQLDKLRNAYGDDPSNYPSDDFHGNIRAEYDRLKVVQNELEARARTSMPRLPQPRGELSPQSPLAEIHTDLDGKIVEQQKGIEQEIKALSEQIDEYDRPQASYENRAQRAELEEFRRSLVEDHTNLHSLRESMRMLTPTALTEYPRAYAELRRLEVRGLISHEQSVEARQKLSDAQDTAIARQFLENEARLPMQERQGRIDAKIRVAQREAAAERTQQQTLWDDLLQKKDAKNLPKIARLWQQVSRNDDAFSFPRTSAKDIETIAQDMSTPTHKIRGISDGQYQIRLISDNGAISIADINGNPEISAPSAGSKGKKQGGGSQLYQAAFAWAHNNGKVIHPSNALSTINAYVRRTSNMLSSALRFGTTRHMIPDAAQGVKNWKTPEPVKEEFSVQFTQDAGEGLAGEIVQDERGDQMIFGTRAEAEKYIRTNEGEGLMQIAPDKQQAKSQADADANNIAQLAMRESEQVMKAVPGIAHLDFDFKTGKMIDTSNGSEVTPADLTRKLEAAGKGNTFEKGIGLSTAQRAIITASALREAEGGSLARADRGRGNRLVKQQRSLLYMPEAGTEGREEGQQERSGSAQHAIPGIDDQRKPKSAQDAARNRLQAEDAKFMPYAGENARGFDDRKNKGETFTGPYDKRERFEIGNDRLYWKNDNAPKASDAGKVMALGELIAHPELFKAYPDMAEIPVRLEKANGRTSYVGTEDAIHLAVDAGMKALIHEIQHAIQEREDFAKGANTRDPGYWKSAGEIEARDAGERMYYDPHRRAKVPPFSSEEIDPEDANVTLPSQVRMPANSRIQSHRRAAQLRLKAAGTP